MRQRTGLCAALLASSVIALIAVAAPAGAAPSGSGSPSTPKPFSVTATGPNAARSSHATVHGVLLGASAREHTAGQTTSFLAAHAGLLPRAKAQAVASPAAGIHPAQGTGFVDEGNDQGSFAVQSVSTSLHPTDSGTTIYTPTMYPAGGACIEVSTVYTSSTQAVEAWDWCNHIDFEASVAINSDFISRYTNGSGSYTVEIAQTDASNNTWTAYLYDYTTSSYDTFYTSAGSSQAGTTGWDVNELYSNVQGNGQSYACADMAGITFSANDIYVELGGNWVLASPSNANTEFDQPAANFDCPAMQYQMVTPYNHWQVTD